MSNELGQCNGAVLNRGTRRTERCTRSAVELRNGTAVCRQHVDHGQLGCWNSTEEEKVAFGKALLERRRNRSSS